ncbi:MAG: tRNA 5-methoxyuridine(34)/uridine 5-oxyacetic acid(34) synthase CmoB [Thioalkalispiraceae bacterium]|jgi:tRNA (mo5U34)-methyltransferase
MYSQHVFEQLAELGHADWAETLKQELLPRFKRHGKFTEWQTVLENLPEATATLIDLNQTAIEVGIEADLTEQQHLQLIESLKQFHPWRKGPFKLFGHYIDTEWRSDWKWDRLKNHIAPLAGRKVLDIGCGSGYHCWRMRGAGADMVLGIDPTIVFVMQYFALQHYIQDDQVNVLPLGIEDLPSKLNCFDTVFSMGILYHRRDPKQHLQEVKSCLRAGGEMVLETLVIEESYGDILVPAGRYAQMKNIWAIPNVKVLENWLTETGFNNVRCIDVTVTSIEEQRVTEWMQYQSLVDYLDPDDQSKTVEGYPAPRRAIVLAET